MPDVYKTGMPEPARRPLPDSREALGQIQESIDQFKKILLQICFVHRYSLGGMLSKAAPWCVLDDISKTKIDTEM